MGSTYYMTVNGKIRSEQRSGEAHSRDYVLDPLGSVIQIYQNGWPIADACYEPYGGIYTQWNMEGKTFTWLGGWGYRQTGVEWSSVYVRARHYSRGLSNWTSVDPLWPSEMAYGYVEGRVMTGVDYWGRQVSNDLIGPISQLGGPIWFDGEKFLRDFKRDCVKLGKSIYRSIRSSYHDKNCMDCVEDAKRLAGRKEAPYFQSLINDFGFANGTGANGAINAITHCHSACVAFKLCGYDCAFDYLNRWQEGIDPTTYSDPSRMDTRNNNWGFMIGASQSEPPVSNYANAAFGYAFGLDKFKDCLPGCVDAYLKGFLTIKIQREKGQVIPLPKPSGNVWK